MRGSALFEIDGDHVEAAGLIVQAPARQEVDRHPDDPLLLHDGHRRRRRRRTRRPPAPSPRRTRGRAVAGDDVNFAKPRAIAALKNCVPAARQFRAREIFAHFPEGLPAIRWHGR